MIVDGIPFRVRHTDLAKQSVEFKDEIDPKEALGDADLEFDENEENKEAENEGEDAEGDSPTIKVSLC